VSGHEWAEAAGQLGQQARAAATLTRILERAAGEGEGLPPIAWTVQRTDAAVVGRCHAAGRHERREEFIAWREAISRWTGRAADVERHTDSLGTVRLRARWQGEEGVQVSVAADIEAEDEL
jgi:hypothetical protein